MRLRVIKGSPGRRGVRIRIPKPKPRQKTGVLIRLVGPAFLTERLPSTTRASVSVAPGVLALAVARSRGASMSWRRYRVRLSGDDVRPGVAATNLRAPREVAFALRGVWNDAGLPARRVEMVSLVVPDQVVRMAVVPLEGREPAASEGDAMARWALRDLFPMDDGDCRVDWAVLSNRSTPGAPDFLLAVGAAVDVIREYEAIVEELGLEVGRVVPMSIALAASVDRALPPAPGSGRLVLCEVGGLLAGLVEADGVPRLHRAWRRLPDDLGAELRAIDRYVRQRLGVTIAEATLAGPRSWKDGATAACEALGWQTGSVSRWAAHRGALQ